MQRRVTHLTGPYPIPAAAIKLGYATRTQGLGYLEGGLEPLIDKFTEKELLVIRGLISEISQLYLEQSSDRYKNERHFRSDVDAQLDLIKLPALITRLDQSSLANGNYGKWYQLGVAWGECTLAERGALNPSLPDCCDRFASACHQLTEAELGAFAPCKLWIELWSHDADPEEVLRQIIERLPQELSSCAVKFPHFGLFSDFFHFILAAAELTPQSSSDESNPNALRNVPPTDAPVADEKEPYIFRRSGTDWEIRFQSGNSNLYRDSDGLLYLSCLLGSPDRGITPQQLYGIKIRYKQPLMNKSIDWIKSTSDDHNKDGTPSAATSNIPRDAGDLIDDEAIENYRRELASYDADIEKAKSNNDETAVAWLQKEKQSLEEHLIRATGLFGKTAKISPEHTNTYNKVSNSINRAINNIKTKDPALSHHLDNCVKRGNFVFVYEPEKPIVWSN